MKTRHTVKTGNTRYSILAKTAGVTIRATGGLGSTSRLSVRGLEGKRIGFFIDETPMNDQSDFVDLNDIPVDMIDRIEIYKGVVPAKLGGSSMGGAVNIVIKEYPEHYADVSHPTPSPYGGEIIGNRFATDSRNTKFMLLNKLYIEYIISKRHSVIFNSLIQTADGSPSDELKIKSMGKKVDFDSHMRSWVVGMTYDYRSLDQRFLNSITGRYYWYGMETQYKNIYVTNPVEDISLRKTSAGFSEAMRYRLTPGLMAKLSGGYDVRIPADNELLGDGKVAAFVACTELNGDNPYTAHNSIAVIIDINNKTVKRIQGIPNTDPHSCSIDLYDGKVYFAAYGVNASGIFAYDPSNEAVEHVQECNTDISYLKIF